MIVSASRRTDIPAFYADWFMNRIREGFARVRNPFNAAQVRTVLLTPDHVDAIVFWTRNPEKLMASLDELDARGHRYYFHYTITGAPRALERSTPGLEAATAAFVRLSERIGPDRVIWRFDPILMSSRRDAAGHERDFAAIAAALRGATRRVAISFADFYAKTNRNLARIPELFPRDLRETPDEALRLAQNLAAIAKAHGIEAQSCSETLDLAPAGVARGKCIDAELIARLFGRPLKPRKDRGQRPACGCMESVDIGQYDSCLHGCLYCYATASPEAALRNHQRHYPASPFLIGGARDRQP